MDMGVFYHDLFSTPILLNSSELIFETSRSAPARARNKSSKIEITTNIVHSFLYDYYNHFEIEKIYPLTVLILSCISLMQEIYQRRTKINFVPLSYTFLEVASCRNLSGRCINQFICRTIILTHYNALLDRIDFCL